MLPLSACFFFHSILICIRTAQLERGKGGRWRHFRQNWLWPAGDVAWQAFWADVAPLERNYLLQRTHFFEDEMVSGAFRSFQHKHFFQEESDGTWMEDRLTFATPIPLLGRVAEVLVLKNYLGRFLEQRNTYIKHVAESDLWRRYLEP